MIKIYHWSVSGFVVQLMTEYNENMALKAYAVQKVNCIC